MDFKRVTYFELFRRAETSARVSAPKLRKRFWNLVTVIFGVPKKSKLAIRRVHSQSGVDKMHFRQLSEHVKQNLRANELWMHFRPLRIRNENLRP